LSPDELAAMRAFVASLLQGVAPTAVPPLELVRANNLGPIAYRLGLAACRDDYAASSIAAARRAALLRELVAVYAPRGIRLALIKGAALVGTIYPDPAERPMQDLDLLIRPVQLQAAIGCLQDLGFRRMGMARKLSGYYHAIAYTRAGQIVELHRNIVQPYRTRFWAGELWRRAIPDPLGSGAERLDRIDELLLCLLHMARHELAVPVINYLDVARLWRRLDPDERAILHERARASRISRAVAAVLSMTELLARGASDRPRALLPSTDAILVGAKPERLRQLAQKLLLTEGPLEAAALGWMYVQTYVDGRRRLRRDP
jgi:hypothetical protein